MEIKIFGIWIYLTFLVGMFLNPAYEVLNLFINFLFHFYFTALYLVTYGEKEKPTNIKIKAYSPFGPNQHQNM